MTEDRHEVLGTAAAEVAAADPADDAEVAWVRHRRPAAQPTAVYTVRLPADRIEELRALAEARGTKPTALLRAWAIEQLDAAGRPRDRDRDAERWERDFRVTSEHLRALLDERPGA